MKTSELKKWMKYAGISRKELAEKCRVSKRTMDGWFLRNEIPELAAALIERIMTESINLSFSIGEFGDIVSYMRSAKIDSFEKLVKMAVMEKISQYKRAKTKKTP
ncbi:MAG: helix-turn-helix domain-containing protein [Opitutales bacterium]|nr:helix-turn-helix domain-containing protein [Opitutales bacterium]